MVGDRQPVTRQSFETCMIDASLSAMLALVVGCASMGVVFAIPPFMAVLDRSGSLTSAMLGGVGSTISFFVVALIIGLLPTILVGAPLYGVLRYFECDRYWTTGLLGMVIGLAVWGIWLAFAPFASWLLVPPTVVAVFTHRFSLLWRRRRVQVVVNQSESPAL